MRKLITILLFMSVHSSAFAICTASVEADRSLKSNHRFKSSLIRAGDREVLFTTLNSGEFLFLDLGGTINKIDQDTIPNNSIPFKLNNGNFALGFDHGMLKIFDSQLTQITTFNSGISERISGGTQLSNGTIVANSYDAFLFFFNENGTKINTVDGSKLGDSMRITDHITELKNGTLLVTMFDLIHTNYNTFTALFDKTGNLLDKIVHVDLNQFTDLEEVRPGVVALNGRVPDDDQGIVDFYDVSAKKSLHSILYAKKEYPIYVKALSNGNFMIAVDVITNHYDTRLEFYDPNFYKINETYIQQSGFDMSWKPLEISMDTVVVPVRNNLLFMSKDGLLKFTLKLEDMPVDAPVELSPSRIAVKSFSGNIDFISHQCL